MAVNTQRIRTALGLHPQLAHARQSELPLFDHFFPATRYIGEIGLDGAPEFRSHWQSQVAIFEHILEKCSSGGGRILSIHSRRAADAVLDHLEKFSSAGTPILHWFSGTLRELDRAVSLGCWFSVGPAMLVSEKGRKLAARMPPERVLTESDGPFAQSNGRPMMPWDVGNTIPILSEIWSSPPNETQQIIHRNLQSILTSPSTCGQS